MANLYKRKRFTVITIVYWFLLTYIITALLFWLFSLLRQNTQMAEYKIMQLKKDDVDYITQVEAIRKQENTKVAQYVGEGVTFMFLIMLGAVFVYRATRRQIRLNNQQQNFMMAVTHELKTPIAVTKLNLETMLKHKLDPQKSNMLLNNTLQEANRLNVLCDNILMASQLDAGHYLSNKEKFNLGDLVFDSVSDFAERFPQRQFHHEMEEEIEVTADKLQLQLAINNLIDNALKYSPKDKPVTVRLKRQAKKATLEVIDEGEGIKDSEKSKIFDKFYRSGNENTRKAKGTGLGLFLTRKIIYDHKGTIKVTDNTPSGCIFVCTLAIT